MPGATTAAIDVRRLTRHFDDRVAVEDLTLTVAPGEIVALLGPNGAGKTTTLRLLAGLLGPSSGEGTVAGVALAGHDQATLRARVGLLTETPGLWDRLSVWTNLMTYARLHAVAEPAARVRRVLEQLGLAGRANDVAAVLSKGLRQRVAIARAILHAPAVLLLDEPTSGLDPAAAKDVRAIVTNLARDGAAALVCTHNLAEAEALAGRIGIVKTRLLGLDTPYGLGVRPGGVTLEDVYLALTGEA
ncbi:MAG: ABC transporter ATP-binding protein [Acidobacteria bacterium]|nr:ABC transporter ATP-binding protein [Acidobacteriota bacterium]